MDELKITDIAREILAEAGLELDHLSVKPLGRRKILRITVDGDGADGKGPVLDDISSASSKLSAAFDASDATGETPYTLEVTSRGVTAPLTETKHYRRNLGRLVTVQLEDTEATGRIMAVGDDAVTLDVDGETSEITLADVRKAVVQVEMTKPKKEKKTRNRNKKGEVA